VAVNLSTLEEDNYTVHRDSHLGDVVGTYEIRPGINWGGTC